MSEGAREHLQVGERQSSQWSGQVRSDFVAAIFFRPATSDEDLRIREKRELDLNARAITESLKRRNPWPTLPFTSSRTLARSSGPTCPTSFLIPRPEIATSSSSGVAARTVAIAGPALVAASQV